MTKEQHKKELWSKIVNYVSEVKTMNIKQAENVLDNYDCGECPNSGFDCYNCPIYIAEQTIISDIWGAE